MDFEENMVEEVTEEAEDLLPEVTEEPEETGESLDTLTDEEDEPAEETAQTQGTSEPGYVQKRISKAVAKAVAETEARMQAMFEQQMAPIRAKMMEDEAQELVRNRQVADIEMARELVRLRQGMPQQETVKAPSEAAPSEDAGVVERINMLKHQAAKIKANTGLDVIAEWNSNEEIKNAVMNGEMDFYDVAETMKEKPKKRPPSPMRSPNGASGMTPNAIESMSDAQFAKLEKRIREGARYTLR